MTDLEKIRSELEKALDSLDKGDLEATEAYAREAVLLLQ